MIEYAQAPEYLCGHLKSEIKDEKTLKLIDAAHNQGRHRSALARFDALHKEAGQ